MEEIYLAGGCLWGVQEYLRHVPGIKQTEVGRANGSTQQLDGDYDGYAECVKTQFDPKIISLETLISCYFEIIDPYSVNKQGIDANEHQDRLQNFPDDYCHIPKDKLYKYKE